MARNRHALRKRAGGRRGAREGTATHLSASAEASVAEQLRDVLQANHVRVVDLFREWDTDKNGVIDQVEFRDAILYGHQCQR